MAKKNVSAPVPYYHTQEIKDVVRASALACYGVVDFARREDTGRADKRVKKGIIEDAAIYVNKNNNRTFSVDIYLILSKDVKITEALVECQKTVMFQLNKAFDNLCVGVNVYGEKLSSK